MIEYNYIPTKTKPIILEFTTKEGEKVYFNALKVVKYKEEGDECHNTP